MSFLLRQANVFINGGFKNADILIKDDRILKIADEICCDSAEVFELKGKYIFPGFVDVHVHFREPGFSYKETIRTGSEAAARGGYTLVCTMPNLSPVPDCLQNLKQQLDIIKRDAVINVVPYGALTMAEKGAQIAALEEMAPYVAGFSDDGKGVQKSEMMSKAMLIAKKLGKVIAAHCEDETLLNGGYIHDGKYAEEHAHKGICSASEWKQVERDIDLLRKTGAAYHVCHVSSKESVALIRAAKADGINITCETGPHYLVLCDEDLQEDGRFKMNPPLRSSEDRKALIEGVLDGTIDMIATDHAPHSAEEKGKGLEKSLMGVVGLETSFPILYTELVKKGILSLEKLIDIMSVKPSERFGFENGIFEGAKANITVFDLEEKYTIDSKKFLSKGRSTPFEGRIVFGRCIMTFANGRPVWRQEN